MMKEGILHVIGDIIVSETDPLVLVCFHFSFILCTPYTESGASILICHGC